MTDMETAKNIRNDLKTTFDLNAEVQKPLPENIRSIDNRVLAVKEEILPGLFWAESKKVGSYVQGYLLHHSNAPLWRGPVAGKCKTKILAKKMFSSIDWTRDVLELQKDTKAIATLRSFEKLVVKEES